MSTDPNNLESVLRSLEQRLAKVEGELAALRQSSQPVPPPMVPTIEQLRSAGLPIEPPPLPAADPPTTIFSLTEEPPAVIAAPPTAPPSKRDVLRSLPHAEAPITYIPPKPYTKPYTKPAPSNKPTLEMFVGGKGLAALGAIILVVGFGLFLKYAYDQGWLKVNPVIRCLSGAGIGLALVGVGEWLRRKYGALAASGSTAAGLGVLYTSAFAAYKLFNLVGPGAAFALLAATAVFGVFIGARSRLIIVAALSLFAGYITPYLFSGAHSPVWALPAYLLMLLAIGLGLAGWRGGLFVTLRTLVWWGTVILGGVWALHVISTPRPGPGAAVVFVILAWCAIQLELTLSALRGPLSAVEADAEFQGRFVPEIRRWRPLVSSFSITAWCVGLVIQSNFFDHEWLAPVGIGGATLLLSFFLGGVLTPALRPPDTDRERLAGSLLIQTAGLVILALAIALSGLGQVLAWVVLGTGAIVAGKWFRARPFDLYGLCVLTLAAGRLVAYDSWASGLTAGPTPFAGLQLSQWSLGMELCAAAWIAMGLLVRGNGQAAVWRRVGELAVGVGLMLAGGGLVHAEISTWLLSMIASFVVLAISFAAWRLRSNLLLAMSLPPILLAVVSSFISEWWRVPTIRYLGLELSTRAMAPAVLGVTLLIARVFANLVAQARSAPERKPTDAFAHAALGTAMLGLACVHLHSAPLSMTIAWSLIAGGWLVSASRNAANRSTILATITLLAAIVGWSVFCLVKQSPMEHSSLLPALPIVAGFAVCAKFAANGKGFGGSASSQGALLASSCGVALFFIGSSFEIARVVSSAADDPAVRGSAISIYWGFFAVALIAAGFVRRVAWIRYVGLGLLGVASLKAVVLDLGSVPPVWRIASFIGLGVLMLLVHFAYSRLSARLLGNDANHSDPAA